MVEVAAAVVVEVAAAVVVKVAAAVAVAVVAAAAVVPAVAAAVLVLPDPDLPVVVSLTRQHGVAARGVAPARVAERGQRPHCLHCPAVHLVPPCRKLVRHVAMLTAVELATIAIHGVVGEVVKW